MKIVDYYSLERETIAISCSLFDRFVAKTSPTQSRDFQLIALTTLYMAVKLNDRKTSSTLKSFVRLGRNQFSDIEIEQMEMNILFTLEWLVNPPTPQAFISHFFEVPSIMILNQSQKRVFLELAVYIIEIMILQAQFIPERNSTIALTSVVLAMSVIDTNHVSYEEQMTSFKSLLSLTKTSLKDISLLCDRFKTVLKDTSIDLNEVSRVLDPENVLYQYEDSETEYHRISYVSPQSMNARPVTPS